MNATFPKPGEPMRNTVLTVLAIVLLSAGAAHAAPKSGTKLMATWSDPSQPITAGSKVLVVFQSNDNDMRRAVETAMAADIPGALLGIDLLPNPEMLQDTQATRFQLKRHGIEYVVLLRVDGTVPDVKYTQSGEYQTPTLAAQAGIVGYWGYWNNAYKTQFYAEKVKTSDKVIVQAETAVFNVPNDKKIWSSTSQTFNPKDMGEEVAEVLKANAEAMRKAGMLPKK